MQYRIGNGYDVHRFAEEPESNATLMLAGIRIPFECKLEAHSDGDVVIHALCDAMLGALALGDIGKHFPDTDEQYAGISSVLLLEKTFSLIQKQGWALSNADITVVAEAPKLAPYKEAMRAQLAQTLSADITQVSVKATTTERLGFTGRQEGIAVYAVVLLSQ
jgi:2-C-methyl-D-erythritol 2,4-cyclodiphosphate synthase